MTTAAGVPDGVDHLIWAVPDLEEGRDAIERRLGVRPALGGRHPEYGTRNALLGLGPATYLEVMAPDPGRERPPRGRLFGLDAPGEPRLATWVLRAEAIEGAAARARSRGVPLGPVRSGSRERPDGSVLGWRLTDPYAMPLGGVIPFLIAWGETPHPASSAPPGGELVGLVVQHPEPAAACDALAALDVAVAVEAADGPGLVATIRTGAGEAVELR